MKTKILVTGGSGLIGRALIRSLQEKNCEISVLSRSKMDIPGTKVFLWEPDKDFIDTAAIQNQDVIIHLAGENIASGRWTLKKRKSIINSRVKSTILLVEHIKKLEQKPHTFISASAIGYYGTFTSDQILEENDPAGTDFLAQVVKTWENAVSLFPKMGIRTVKLRTGVVLSNEGGALREILTKSPGPFLFPVGKGNQWVPWIAIDDLVSVFEFMIFTPGIKGVFNAVSPQPVTNMKLMQAIAQVTGKKIVKPGVPAFILKLFYGEMASLLTEGTRVSASKLLSAGFKFKCPDINSALECLLS